MWEVGVECNAVLPPASGEAGPRFALADPQEGGRGFWHTTAASHEDNAVVEQLDNEIFREDWYDANIAYQGARRATSWEPRLEVEDPPYSGQQYIRTGTETNIDDGDGIDENDLTITVDATAGFPDSGVLLIDSERIQYGSKDATSFTVAGGGRGYAGTSGAAHADNAFVKEIHKDWVDVKPAILPFGSERIRLRWVEYD